MASTEFGARLERAVRERAARAAATAAVQMEVNLKRNFQPHRKSGDTQAATSVRLESLTETTITYVARADTPQARFTNDGTRPHVIAARNAKTLRFQWPDGPASLRGRDGFYHFTSVNHPGYRGSGWWDFTLATWHDLLENALT